MDLRVPGIEWSVQFLVLITFFGFKHSGFIAASHANICYYFVVWYFNIITDKIWKNE